MHTSQTPTFRKIAAGSAIALAATGAAFIASPASAATSASLAYTCQTPIGERTFTATHTVDDTVEYAGSLVVTSNLVVPEDVAQTLLSIGVTEVDGTVTNQALAQNFLALAVEETMTRTPVPATGPMTIVAVGSEDLSPYAGATPAGTLIDINVNDVADDSDLDAVLNSYGADGDDADSDPDLRGQFTIPCELNDGQTLDVTTVEVVKAVTETTAKLGYAAKAGKVVGKAIVDAPESGASVVGDVKFVLKRNGTKVGQTIVDGLSANEVATAKWAAPKKGNYKLVTKYLGDSNFVASQDSITKSF